MNKVHAIVPVPPGTVKARTLITVPSRLSNFLRGARRPEIFQLLESAGFHEGYARQAWDLLDEHAATKIPAGLEEPDSMREAISNVEEFHAVLMTKTKLLVELTHPPQARFLFHDHLSAKGVEAAVAVTRFFERLDELSHSSARKATRERDLEAADLVRKAGISKAARAEVLAAVEVLRRMPEVAGVDPLVEEALAKRDELLRKMYSWLSTWTSITKLVTTRRDHWLHLGIGKRRSGKDEVADTTNEGDADASMDDAQPGSELDPNDSIAA